MGESIKERIPQLFVFTGARNTGKSTLAYSYPYRLDGDDKDKINAHLAETAVFDSENSANNFRKELARNGLGDFGTYINLQERFTGLPSDDDLLDRISKGEPPWVDNSSQNALIGYYEHIVEAFNSLMKNSRRNAILDTGEKFEAGMAAYVEANKRKFGITSTAYGKLWSEGVFPLYQNFIQGVYGRGIETLILVFHLKNVWEGSRPIPGKVAMSGKKILQYLSSLMIWTVNDSRNAYGEPAGLVLKERMGRMVFEGGRFRMRQMLPPRIPTCDWFNIENYLQNGYNNSNPSPREQLSKAEEEMISPLLTDAQTALMLSDARRQEQENSLLMAQAGLLPTSSATNIIGSDSDRDSSETLQSSPLVQKPRNRAEAVQFWKNLGRPIPELMRKLSGMEDGEIEGRWDEISGVEEGVE